MFSVCIFVFICITSNFDLYIKSYNILFLNISCLYLHVFDADVDVPVVYLNDELVSNRINILEGKPFHLSCFVEANPTPTVQLGKIENGGTAILSEARGHWSNYSFGTGAQLSDTGTYVCYGQSSDLKTNTKAIELNILCKSVNSRVNSHTSDI